MAEVYHNNIIDIDLESGTLFRSFLNHTIGSGDNNANWYGVRVFRKGQPIALSGCSVQGLFMPASGSAILISDGTHTLVSGNEAAVLLPQACYNVKGQFTLTIKIIGTNSYSITDTVRIIDGVVADTYSANPVAPTAAVPTYQEILAVYEQMVAAKDGSVRFDIEQELTAAQMTQARGNIAAASESDVSDLKSALNSQEVTYKSLIPAYETGKIGSDGSIIADNSLRHIPFTDISNYSIVKIGISTQSGYIAFYTSDKTFISAINQADYTVGSIQSFVKPENAAYFMFTASVYASIYAKEFYVSEYYIPYKVFKMEDQYNSIIHDLATSDGFDSIIPVYSSGKIDSNGSVSADPSVYYTEYINIMNYAYAAFVVSTDTGYMAFYDSNKQYISSIALNTKTTGKLTLFKKPNQAVYYRTTVSAWHATNNQPVYKRFSYATLENFPPVYYVEKDGKGDFSSLVDAIREAIKHKNSIVYVGDGTWDIVEELGQEYISGVYVGQRGLYLENGIHVICSSKSIIKCEYTGDLDEVKTWLAAFNSGPLGFTLENATIIGKNIRYVIHDERDYTDPELYINKYINCKMYLDNSGNTAWPEMQVIGGGLGINGYIEINGCYFESVVISSQTAPYVITAWHNSQDLNNLNAKSRLEIKNSYFSGQNCTFKITGMGNSPEVSSVFISGCSFGAAPIKAGTDNVSLVSWSNEIRNN